MGKVNKQIKLNINEMSEPQLVTISISTENDWSDPHNLSVEDKDTKNFDDSSPNTQDITSPSNNVNQQKT